MQKGVRNLFGFFLCLSFSALLALKCGSQFSCLLSWHMYLVFLHPMPISLSHHHLPSLSYPLYMVSNSNISLHSRVYPETHSAVHHAFKKDQAQDKSSLDTSTALFWKRHYYLRTFDALPRSINHSPQLPSQLGIDISSPHPSSPSRAQPLSTSSSSEPNIFSHCPPPTYKPTRDWFQLPWSRPARHRTIQGVRRPSRNDTLGAFRDSFDVSVSPIYLIPTRALTARQPSR